MELNASTILATWIDMGTYCNFYKNGSCSIPDGPKPSGAQAFYMCSVGDIEYYPAEIRNGLCDRIVMPEAESQKAVPHPIEMHVQTKKKRKELIMTNRDLLQFIYDRMLNQHNESENIDYMVQFKEYINGMPLAPSCDECPMEELCSGDGNEYGDDTCKDFQEKLAAFVKLQMNKG